MSWLELTTDEMLNHLREVFTDYEIGLITGTWTKFELRRRGLDIFKCISVDTYTENPKDDEKCKWYFSFINMYYKDCKEVPVEITISEYYKYLYEKLMEQEELTRELTLKIIHLNYEVNKSDIRDWKLNNIGI